jgi:putative transposase
MHARGASTREMVGPPRELHAIDVAPDPIGAVGDAVPDEVAARPARPPETVRPPVVFDAPRVKIGDDGPVRGKAGRIAPGMRAGGGKELPGPWLERNEGAEFRPRVINGPKNRGAEDGPIALLDGLKGFPEAITAVFPRAMVQTGIVPRLRRGLDFLSRKDRRPVAAALRDSHRAVCRGRQHRARRLRGEPSGPEMPGHGQGRRRAGAELVPFQVFPALVRRILHAANAVEALNSKPRRAVGARGRFPGDGAAAKLLLPVLNRSETAWIMPPREGRCSAAARSRTADAADRCLGNGHAGSSRRLNDPARRRRDPIHKTSDTPG